jgi:hypothetical protein
MTPRDPRPSLVAASARLLARLLIIPLFLAAPVLAPQASAIVEGVSVSPSNPATCDSVTLRGAGMISACDYLASGEVFGPEPIPVAGPVPAYRTRILFTVRPDSTEQPCILLSMLRYSREFPMGQLPMGQHFVTAVERAYDSNGNVRDTSVVNMSFFVAAKDSCAYPPCVLLGFSPPPSPGVPVPVCDADAVPGGDGCFDVTLLNAVPVGGVQLEIRLLDPQGAQVPATSFTPKAVTAGDRAAGFQTEWQSNGSSVSILLFAPTDAVIAPGRGPILHVCYSVGTDVATGVYHLVFERAMVANPDGVDLPHCPTFARSTGRFCVGSTEGCDLNGDGIADLRDIIRLVRCALAGSACPDTIAARADCNGDGSIDIRDVICCVRKLLHLKRQSMIEPPEVPNPTRIGFDGPASWISPAAGKAEIEVTPSADFGAIDFDVEPAANVRITGARLTNGGGATMEWAARENGVARVLLVRSGIAVTPTPFRVTVDFEPLPDGPSSGTLRLQGGQSATWDAAAAPYLVTASSTPVLPAPVAAPRIEGARPNPFAASTEIPYTLPSPSHVSVRVYDVTGRLVRTLLDATRPAGAGRVTWDGRDASGRSAPTGVYFVKLTTPAGERTARMIKMR